MYLEVDDPDLRREGRNLAHVGARVRGSEVGDPEAPVPGQEEVGPDPGLECIGRVSDGE